MNDYNKDIESLIQQYIRNELSEREAIEFEDYFVDKPELATQVTVARDMYIGIKEVSRAEVKSHSKPNKSVRIGFSSLFSWLWTPAPAYAITGIFALMVGLPTFLDQGSNLESGLVSFSTSTVRGSDRPIAIYIPANRTNVLLIKVAQVEYREYQLQLKSSQNESILWTSQVFVFSALNDHMEILPESLKTERPVLQLVAVLEQGETINVPFCHYSEECYL